MTTQELQQTIDKAVKKIKGEKENDICRYLPSPAGNGYIHHFTMRKMKNEEPQELLTMIKKFIINTDSPLSVPPKPRAPRGTRKRRDLFHFSREDLEKMRRMLVRDGESELARKLTPKNDLATVKRELISSIRHGSVESDLWATYAEIVDAAKQAAELHPEEANA